MLGQQPNRSYSNTRFVLNNSKYASPEPHPPTQNSLLAALSREEYERLLPDLEPVALQQGSIVHRADERDKYVYFLTAGIVSQLYVIENGAEAEFAVTGSEGVIGISSLLGGESMPSQAVVTIAGHAYRLTTSVVIKELAYNGALLNLLLRHTLALITQAGQTAVCNRYHSVQQQLCLIILSCLDRVPTNELAITQERIAKMLGVRRESITAAASRMQKAGVLCYRRGHMVVQRSRFS